MIPDNTSSFKPTEIELIPNDWDVTVLSSVAKCTVGIASSATHAYTSDGILLIRNQNIKEGNISLDDVIHVTEEYEKQYIKKRLKAGDILTIRTGYTGLSAVVPSSLENSQSFTTLITRIESDNLDSHFLCYYFNSEYGKRFFNGSEAGGGQKNVGSKTLETMRLPLPPLPEQKKVAAILSSVDEAIQTTQKVLDQTEKVKKGLLQELLNKGIGHTEFKKTEIGEIPVEWEIIAIGEVTTLKSGGTPRRNNKEFWNGNIPWVKTGEINYKEIVSTEEKITEKGLANSSAKIIPQGSVLLAMYGQGKTRGKVAILGIDATINQACLAIICGEKILNTYFYFLLVLNYDGLRSLSQEGSQKNLSSTLIKDVQIAIPPLTEQKQIASILSSLDESIQKATIKKDQLLKVKKGLMQDLLTGKVRVKV